MRKGNPIAVRQFLGSYQYLGSYDRRRIGIAANKPPMAQSRGRKSVARPN
jgi:hypothetical protein